MPPRFGDSPLLVDAGPLYAYVDADDAHHDACLELLQTHAGPLIVPVLVVTEVASLVATQLGVEPEVRFLGDLAAGAFSIDAVAAGDPTAARRRVHAASVMSTRGRRARRRR